MQRVIAAIIITAFLVSGAWIEFGPAAAASDARKFSRHAAAPDVRIETVSKTKTGKKKTGVGSGVYIGNNIIVTAAHNVKEDVDSFKIRSTAGDVQSGEVLWVNRDYDIAVIMPSRQGRFTAARLSCDNPAVGDSIRAVGNPAGLKFLSMEGSISGGERKLGRFKSVFPTDMTVIGGMSGGANYDKFGDVIGITVAALSFGNKAGAGLGFIVPGSVVCMLLGRV